MLVVKIELWPHGDESKAREIGRAEIYNDATGDNKKGNYVATLLHSGKYFGRPGYWRRGFVRNHNRSQSPYHLVLKALKNCLS